MSGHKPFSKLVEKMSPESRARMERQAERLRAEMPLQELRAALELSQKNLAEILKVDQPAISKMEHRTDMMLSTLRRFIEAMGGELAICARFPAGEVKITSLGELHANENADSDRHVEMA